MPKSLFELTLAAVQETERRVLTFRSSIPVIDAVIRTVFYPFPFVQIGMGELFRPASKWAALTFGLLMFAAFLIPHIELSSY